VLSPTDPYSAASTSATVSVVKVKVKVKISLFQAVKAHRVARG
jgi:hypothetical protein